MNTVAQNNRMISIRDFCHGVTPLTGRLEPWMHALLASNSLVHHLEEHGSPINIIAPDKLSEQVAEFDRVADRHDIDFKIFFARKANKCLAFVDAATDAGCGIDTASENEILQCLQLNVAGRDMICTAAIKPASTIRHCILNEICIAIDNEDELQLAGDLAEECDSSASIALRLGTVSQPSFYESP